jgi:hypothetical protein
LKEEQVEDQKQDLNLRRKTVLNKEEDYNDNPDCQNCPYFINKLVCPFHRKKVTEGVNPMINIKAKGRTSEE